MSDSDSVSVVVDSRDLLLLFFFFLRLRVAFESFLLLSSPVLGVVFAPAFAATLGSSSVFVGVFVDIFLSGSGC